jgi:hypothetical protein
MASRRQRSRKALVSLPKIGLAETKESRPEKMSPRERTIRKRFGSFKAAVDAAHIKSQARSNVGSNPFLKPQQP